MIEFEKIGKTLPYRESDAQVDDMLARIEMRAIECGAEHRRRKVLSHRFAYITSAVAGLAIAVSAAIQIFNPKGSAYDAIMDSKSVGEVLSQMDADAVESEVYYTFNAMPEY